MFYFRKVASPKNFHDNFNLITRRLFRVFSAMRWSGGCDLETHASPMNFDITLVTLMKLGNIITQILFKCHQFARISTLSKARISIF